VKERKAEELQRKRRNIPD